MPWKVTKPMCERAKFVTLHEQGLFSMSELCQRFGVSRRTGYKWLDRFEQGGLDGLKDHSRKPHSSPKQTCPEVQEALLQVRRDHPAWGPKKLLAYLQPRRPDLSLPAAASTVGELLKQHGLSQPRKRPACSWKHPGEPVLQADAPNRTWCADFKGQFPTQDGRDCYPLTITDTGTCGALSAYSRFVLCCHGLPSVRQEGAFAVFERAFDEFGLPQVIRTDNGVPFATQAICGLSKLSVWWIKLGIAHQRIEPGQPQQNGRHERHERMHKTLKRETARPRESDHGAQQVRFDTWRAEFNQERPHEALEMKTPASLYRPSLCPLPKTLPEPTYPGHFQVRLVSKSSMFRLHHRPIFISEALIGEYIGLEETGDGVWSVYFYDVLLGRLSERAYKVRG